MKRIVLLALMLVGILGSVSAQHDDMYFVPKKKVKTEAVEEKANEAAGWSESLPLVEEQESEQTLLESASLPVRALEMDEDAYNRRGSYLTEQGDAVSEFAMDDEGFVLITEEGDTMLMNTDTLKLTRVQEDEGWVNGFEGSDSDYEYAMRIVRFRNPRYAIPVSSPLYWDVVYGGALWPSWDWNIYDDGMYAYVFPTTSNWLYWDYRISYPFGWSPWGCHWHSHWGWHYGHHWGGFYGHAWYDPWYDPYFYGYHPGWHYGHHGFYPGIGMPGWGGVAPGSRSFRNDRHATIASTRRGMQDDNTANRSAVGSTRRTSDVTRTGTSSTRSSSVRVVTGRTGSSSSRSSSAVRSSNRGGGDEVVRRSGSSSSTMSRGSSAGSSSRSSYTRQSTSRSGSGSSYNRPSSTRSSSSSISRSSSSSRSSSYSGSSSSSSRSSSSYSGSSSRSSSSYSSGSSSRSSSSYSGGSSRSSGGSYGGGGSRGGSSSGSRR